MIDMKQLLAILALAFSSSAFAGAETCMPMQAGGDGSPMLIRTVGHDLRPDAPWTISWECPQGATVTMTLPASERRGFAWGLDAELTRAELVRLWNLRINKGQP